ncbi:hypothetical protein LEMLEM_LOCUS1332 [Lemmus lemmus]
MKYSLYSMVMWDFPLYAVVTINELRNCFGPIAELLGNRENKQAPVGTCL